MLSRASLILASPEGVGVDSQTRPKIGGQCSRCRTLLFLFSLQIFFAAWLVNNNGNGGPPFQKCGVIEVLGKHIRLSLVHAGTRNIETGCAFS